MYIRACSACVNQHLATSKYQSPCEVVANQEENIQTWKIIRNWQTSKTCWSTHLYSLTSSIALLTDPKTPIKMLIQILRHNYAPKK